MDQMKITIALQMWGQFMAGPLDTGGDRSTHGFHSPAFWNVALSHYVEMQTSSYMGIWISTSSRFLYNTRTAITLHVKVCSGFHTLVKLILYCYGCCWDKPIAFYGFRQASYSLRPKKYIYKSRFPRSQTISSLTKLIQNSINICVTT